MFKLIQDIQVGDIVRGRPVRKIDVRPSQLNRRLNYHKLWLSGGGHEEGLTGCRVKVGKKGGDQDA